MKWTQQRRHVEESVCGANNKSHKRRPAKGHRRRGPRAQTWQQKSAQETKKKKPRTRAAGEQLGGPRRAVRKHGVEVRAATGRIRPPWQPRVLLLVPARGRVTTSSSPPCRHKS